MSIQRVYSKNAAYQKFEVLKTNRNKRYRYNAFFVEGVRNINEAIANGRDNPVAAVLSRPGAVPLGAGCAAFRQDRGLLRAVGRADA